MFSYCNLVLLISVKLCVINNSSRLGIFADRVGGPVSKTNKAYQTLGDEVSVKTERCENDTWAQTMLREIGKTMAEPHFAYLGSAAVHFYSTQSGLVMQLHEGQVKHQLALGSTSEEFAQFGAIEFIKRMQAHYAGKEKRSIDPNYKVDL